MKKQVLAFFFICALLLGIPTVAYSDSGGTTLYLPVISNSSAATATPTLAASGVYTQSGGSVTQSYKAYASSLADQSAVQVSNSGSYALSHSTITKSGDTSSMDNSSFYGQNAAVLALSGSAITLSDSTITSSGKGGNGAFAYGSGSSVTLSDVTIQATADGGHGVMATGGGSATLNNVNITTSGGASSAIATDRGSGTITVTGGTVSTSGQNSAGLYSTGILTVTGTTFTSTGAEAAVIEGSNSITLTNASLTTSKASKWGVMIYQSMSGDATGTHGVYTMTGGTLANTAASGPLFYVTNSTADITLKGVSASAASGVLVSASAGSWGTSGSNGGTVNLVADAQTLSGSLVADSISSIAATLKNSSSLSGAINAANSAKSVTLTLADAASTWNVTGTSYLTCLTDSSGISGTSISNITGNGYTVYYKSSACSALGGLTYTLSGGGTLRPGS